MLDLMELHRRTYDARLQDGSTIQLLPPKMKEMKKIQETVSAEHAGMDEICDVLLMILNKNKAGKKFAKKWIDEHFTTDEALMLLMGYFEWVTGTQNDPN